MAIIDKDTRMTVATRLANLNYKEQMDSSLAKLNELFEKYSTLSEKLRTMY